MEGRLGQAGKDQQVKWGKDRAMGETGEEAD